MEDVVLGQQYGLVGQQELQQVDESCAERDARIKVVDQQPLEAKRAASTADTNTRTDNKHIYWTDFMLCFYHHQEKLSASQGIELIRGIFIHKLKRYPAVLTDAAFFSL